MANGHHAVLMQSNYIFLTGEGASPEGARPFLDRLDINTLETKRIFQGDAGAFEEIVAMLSTGGRVLLTRHESPTEPPNYWIRESTDSNGNFALPGSLTKQLLAEKLSLRVLALASHIMPYSRFLRPGRKFPPRCSAGRSKLVHFRLRTTPRCWVWAT